MPGDPFQIDVLPDAPLARAAFIAARPLLERVLALGTYRTLYRNAQAAIEEPFESRALRALDISVQVALSDLNHIPRSGPVVVAANHPHGMLDGLALMAAVRRARPDIRVLTNQLLARIPELSDCCLFVDPFDGPDAEARCRAGLRAAHLWLRGGGLLIVFPAGEVAHARHADGAHIDSPWKPAMSRLAIAAGAQVIPSFIHGGNSLTFHAAGHVHPSLRTLLLPRELLKKRGSTVALRLGKPLSPTGLAKDAVEFTESVRAAVDQLAAMVRLNADTTKSNEVPGSVESIVIAPGFSRNDRIAAEVAALAKEFCFLDSGPFQVFCARAEQIPETLREIGRLRAVTYRAVGEGSNSTLDLDRFDERYLHLFSWDREQRRIVGAYRIGQTDRIVADAGVDGLYTRTLFRYDRRLIERMAAPALELGRSFVRAEYQKNYNALLLLWKGIGQFIARHLQYRLLFGPVSISTHYSDTSHQLLMSFLRQNHLAAELSELVEAFHPPRLGPARAASGRIPPSIDEINAVVAREEPDGKGMPVLLRQYLKLNARLIGFNVDPAFGEALDALMLVDLTTVDRPILNRYLGHLDAERFLLHHDANRQTSAAA
jgi:putative hemolysin